MNARKTILLAVVLLLGGACSTEGNVFSLEVGDCFNDPQADEVIDVPIVDCAEAHDYEVYYRFDMADGGFPGETAVLAALDEGCLAQFEGFVGQVYESSDLGYDGLYPTADSWAADDREIACLLYDWNGGRLTGSMEGSGV
jgi:hypothetical protein